MVAVVVAIGAGVVVGVGVVVAVVVAVRAGVVVRVAVATVVVVAAVAVVVGVVVVVVVGVGVVVRVAVAIGLIKESRRNMPKIAINVQGTTIVLTQADERTKVSSSLSPGDGYQLASMLFASVADAAANVAFGQCMNVACSDCQVKIGRARQALAEQAQKARMPKIPVPAAPPIEGATPISEK